MTSLNPEQVVGCVISALLYLCLCNADMQAGKRTHSEQAERQVGCQDESCGVSSTCKLDKGGCGLSLPPKLALCLGLDLPKFAPVPAFIPLEPRRKRKTLWGRISSDIAIALPLKTTLSVATLAHANMVLVHGFCLFVSLLITHAT